MARWREKNSSRSWSLLSTGTLTFWSARPSLNQALTSRAPIPSSSTGLTGSAWLRFTSSGGRVGRSSTQSFAYLLVPSIDHLSKDARERLRALMEYNELGGGFKLAMSDLQIRGGGNLLGVSQSGHIAAIGYDLYLDLLQKTVADLKNQTGDASGYQQTEDVDPEIKPAGIFIHPGILYSRYRPTIYHLSQNRCSWQERFHRLSRTGR